MFAEHFRTFARYNAWANGRLYEACATLPEAEYLRPRPAFFGGLHGTLNHILVGDRAWLGRLTGEPSGIAALDQELYPDLPTLRAAREGEDGRLVALVDGYSEADLDAEISYETLTAGGDRRRRRWILAHLFNHQTHHRGQAHGLLTHAGAAPPPLDLIYYLRHAEGG